MLAAAQVNGRTLHDVRVPTVAYPIANGVKRSGKRVLAVGTDCSVGKMYTALALDAAMQERGMKSSFRATGQTGILITGAGVPLDAVIADFMAGAIEYLTPDNDDDHWDIIEGQGSLFHVSYSGVTLALIHGGQPDALILCHEPTRTHMRGLPGYKLPVSRRCGTCRCNWRKSPTRPARWWACRSTPRIWATRRPEPVAPKSKRGSACRRSIRSGMAAGVWRRRSRRSSFGRC